MASSKPKRPFADAMLWAQSLGLSNYKAWRDACKDPNFPSDVPKYPNEAYEEFPGWGVFLGTGRVASKDQVFKSYEEVVQWAKDEGITSEAQWRERCKDTNFPNDVPKSPTKVFKDRFTTWGDFLGTERVANQLREFRSCDDAAAWAQGQGITTEAEWRERYARKDWPSDVPKNPRRAYGDDFPGWGSFLATGSFAPWRRQFRSVEQAAAWAQAQKVRNEADWRALVQRVVVPSDIPKNPYNAYGKEFPGWAVFLGRELANDAIEDEKLVIKSPRP